MAALACGAAFLPQEVQSVPAILPLTSPSPRRTACRSDRHASGLRARAAAGLALLALAAGTCAQSLNGTADAGSVVARLVARGAQNAQPVALGDLTSFEWDHFTVKRMPAGDGMMNCGRAGLVPCDPALDPPRGQRIQVLLFLRDGQPVYRERIMTELGAFAYPLPDNVPRAQAMLSTCPGVHGRKLWCVQGMGRTRQPDPYSDGG